MRSAMEIQELLKAYNQAKNHNKVHGKAIAFDEFAIPYYSVLFHIAPPTMEMAYKDIENYCLEKVKQGSFEALVSLTKLYIFKMFAGSAQLILPCLQQVK